MDNSLCPPGDEVTGVSADQQEAFAVDNKVASAVECVDKRHATGGRHLGCEDVAGAVVAGAVERRDNGGFGRPCVDLANDVGCATKRCTSCGSQLSCDNAVGEVVDNATKCSIKGGIDRPCTDRGHIDQLLSDYPKPEHI